MATSGSATGGNDVFNGKNRVFWWLVSQDYLAGAHGESIVRWAWCVNWAPGDNCHTILNGQVIASGNGVYFASTVHSFSSGHVHTGDWPSVNSSTGGGFSTGTFTVVHDSDGAGLVRLQANHVGTSGATSSSDTGVMSLPDIPQTVASPSSASASRVNDTQANISWTNNSTGTAPYANVKVYRSTDGGGYALIATLGVVTSYSDTTISANHKYTYRMSAVGQNTVEVGYATTSAIWTTPGTPTTLVAAKVAGGDIQLTWSNNTNYSEYTVRIEESQNGGAYSELTSVSGGVATYTHTSPSTLVTHKYRVRARSTTGSLNSSYSNESSTITLLSTANAPTALAPSGVAKDAAENIVLTWTHNPADGTPQSKRRVQTKVDAGSFSDAVNDTSTTSSYTITGGTLSNGHTITWKVATAGENGTLSSFSSEASFTTSARPTVTIDDLSDYHSSALTAGFTYFQAQSSSQATWRAYLLDSTDNILESKSGTTEAEVAFSKSLADATTYKVQVYVTSAAGLESLVGSETFTTDFLPPAASYISASYDADSGTMVLTITGEPPVEDVTFEIAAVDIQRQINGGAWVTIARDIELSVVEDVLTAVVIDTKPTIKGSNNYRVLAKSATPTSAFSDEEENVTAEVGWSFLSTGTGFQDIVRMKAAPTFAASASRDKAVYHFAGRTKPVQFTGEAQDLKLAISGTLIGTSSTPEEFEAMAYTDAVVLWRDPTGRRMFGSIGQVQTSRSTRVLSKVSFSVTELDYDE